MSNHLKKHGVSLQTARLYTRPDRDAFEMIYFKASQDVDDAGDSSLICPHNWSDEAASILAERAACQAVPETIKAIEENTVPSWLWRHQGDAQKNTGRETGVTQIFERAVGAAVYAGWKQNVFADENAARAFYDEARYALAQRFIALDPRLLATLGLDWAYGISQPSAPQPTHTETQRCEIPNTVIDAIVGGSRERSARTQWQKITNAKARETALTFTDIAADWGLNEAPAARTVIDLMTFRHNDGSVNFKMLRHATRLLVILLDLHDMQDLAIGTCNLAPLLMALALPFDSDAARATAGAISAIITSEAYATSAELASLRGMSAAFTANRELVMRTLRNRQRAAYGDRNDYEKISVLPAPLALHACPDLALVADARNGWDRAVEQAQRHGLRHVQVTSLFASPELAIFTESVTQGLEPMRTLTVIKQTDSDLFQREIHPSVAEGLMRLGFDQTRSIVVTEYIDGTHTLEKAPVINHKSLRAHKFTAGAIRKIEDYLPYVNDIRLAFTPWIVGEEFCRKVLKIPAAKLRNARLNMLAHMGFTAATITAANVWCYGRDRAKGAPGLSPAQAATFACADEITPEAYVRMAASLQPFVSGDVGLNLSLPANVQTERVEKLLLGAWRQGVKAVTLDYDAVPLETKPARKKLRTSVYHHAKAPALPVRQPRPKAAAGLAGRPSSAKTKSSRRWSR